MAASPTRWGAGFSSTERFLAEVASAAGNPGSLRPGYIFAGDETFLYERCRRAILQAFVPAEMRDFCLSDFDLAEVSIFEALDRAQTPSLMAPFQVIFMRNLKTLYTRGAKKEEFAAIDGYFRSPNPQALLVFVADHIRISADPKRMDMQDKDRYERIRETLGDWCGLVELARVEEADATRWLTTESERHQVRFDTDAARELVDALGADMMLIASEFEKLLLYAGERRRITLGDVETMVLAAKQRSLYELTDAISAKDKHRALLLLQGLLNASDGGEDSAIGHLYMLARTFRQMLVILEKNVRDSRAIWQALWQGFRMPPFAAEDLIRQARRYKSRHELTRAIRLIARADLELRSSPPDKRLVLERLVLELASEPRVASPIEGSTQYPMQL
ncbi:DNA polymerase III delta subunit [Acidisarcina polymorpha]|uniref:DNA polymerase III subunit delta n=1 Tax=Acidisarcina polymorpha TaxID=2211140 RepID=A0A2Z5G4Q6_9BACT|nr:DNA polymerase III subunit delta [Acidisarcina polymorpha]AXC13727.1 DNA polymerase III delta subunit [Acidisarcina polymorpha]